MPASLQAPDRKLLILFPAHVHFNDRPGLNIYPAPQWMAVPGWISFSLLFGRKRKPICGFYKTGFYPSGKKLRQQTSPPFRLIFFYPKRFTYVIFGKGQKMAAWQNIFRLLWGWGKDFRTMLWWREKRRSRQTTRLSLIYERCSGSELQLTFWDGLQSCITDDQSSFQFSWVQ